MSSILSVRPFLKCHLLTQRVNWKYIGNLHTGWCRQLVVCFYSDLSIPMSELSVAFQLHEVQYKQSLGCCWLERRRERIGRLHLFRELICERL